MQDVRFGVLGTARIATKVGEAIREAHGAELVAIGSRSLETARAWASEHGAARAYGSYEEVLSDAALDAVYIPLPPSMHREWVIKAAEAGKHILCEKPAAMNAGEVVDMFAACRAHGVQYMDGTMWSHHPRTKQMKAVLDSGVLGPLRRITSAFTVNIPDTPKQIRFKPELGGGALYDLGWYCVRASLWAFGDLPERVFASGEYHRGVDMNVSALMRFSEQRMASFDCGFDMALRKWFEVAGIEGSLVCDDFLAPRDVEHPRFWTHGANGESTTHESDGVIQQVAMVEQLCEIVVHGSLDNRWFDESMATQKVVDALLKSLKLGQEVSVE